MYYVNLDKYENKTPQFYLGVEEYLLKNSSKEYLLLWTCLPSVIYGTNQVVYNEVNLNYLKENNINLCRRFSGGGAVYADTKNLMYTFILNVKPNETRQDIFAKCLAKICKVFKDRLNLEVTYSGRNDLLVNGAKISGSAFYYYGSRVVFHGTLLYDVDILTMSKVLKPNKKKLDIKGIDSVAKRVINLKDVTKYSLLEIKKALKEELASEEINSFDFNLIKKYQDKLESNEWIMGKTIEANYHNEIQFSEGIIAADIKLVNGLIYDVKLSGDYFSL